MMATKSRQVVAIATCRNRKDLTEHMLRAVETAGNRINHVFITDDGSDDGTSEMLVEFSEVTALRGSGNDYWCGGMRRAWGAAIDRFPASDLLLLNDDIKLDDGALVRFLDFAQQHPNSISGGTFLDSNSLAPSYGGYSQGPWIRTRFTRVRPPVDQGVEVDALNGNMMYVPNSVVVSSGGLSTKYMHQFGDLDICVRASRAGHSVLLAPGVYGTCDTNVRRDPLVSNEKTFVQRWHELRAPKGLPPDEWWHFCKTLGGTMQLPAFLAPYAKFIVRSVGINHRRTAR